MRRLLGRIAIFLLLLYCLQIGGEWWTMNRKMENFIEQVEANRPLETDNRTVPLLVEGEKHLGAPGDIPLTFEALNLPITIAVGGHSGVVVDNRRVVESSGLESWDKNITKYWRNNWRERYDVVLMLRVKGSTEEEAAVAVEKAESLLGKRYDYLFNRTEYWIYCSEVPWIAWKEAGYNLNYDGLQVTPNDLLVSPKTEIVYLKVTDKEGVAKEYYLSE
ncbi:hypothetical protein JR334_01625 [Clostridia bacterium]|nr:hypothetical protein JR334_01625 [Clostridia bacterium]